MKKHIIFLTLMISMACHAQPQTNYLKMRSQIAVLGCGDFDSATLMQAHLRLLKVDTTHIDSNLNIYFQDMGWSFYKLCGPIKDSMMMEHAIYYFKRAYEKDTKDFLSLWNMMNAMCFNKHCTQMNSYIPVLKSITPRKLRKDLSTKTMPAVCAGKTWWFNPSPPSP